jgi:hypothetical protein
MVFNIKRKPEVTPDINTKRFYIKFAWFPLLWDDKIYWLETLCISEIYKCRKKINVYGGYDYYVNEWERISVSILEPK